jgi:hypothetical protein
MNTLLILYPHEFSSHAKFQRKVDHIVSRWSGYSIVSPSDERSLIREFCSRSITSPTFIEDAEWRNNTSISHAIVFDDGEVFRSEIEMLQSKNIIIRVVQIKITRVVNIKKETKFASVRRTKDYEYIGRGSYWGNPYSIFAGETREEVIRKFKYDFDFEKFPNKEKSEVFKLVGKRLGCFCKPDGCHGDVLADFLNSWDDGN